MDKFWESVFQSESNELLIAQEAAIGIVSQKKTEFETGFANPGLERTAWDFYSYLRPIFSQNWS